MSKRDLTQKTFDDILADSKCAAGDSPERSPSKPMKVPGLVVLERLGNGIRVSAQDHQENVLWGFVATKVMLEQPHGTIALYARLREIINEALTAEGLEAVHTLDALAAATAALTELQRVTSLLHQSIQVKKASEVTRRRAAAILRVVSDAIKMIEQETPFVSRSRCDDVAEESA
jgi:hypothetical protein